MKINSHSFIYESYNTKQKPGLFYGPKKPHKEEEIQKSIMEYINKKLSKNKELFLFYNVTTNTEIQSKRMKNARGDVTHTNDVVVTFYTQTLLDQEETENAEKPKRGRKSKTSPIEEETLV